MGIGKEVGRRLGPQAHKLAPELTTNFVHEALARAISGTGPLPGAAKVADRRLAEADGDAGEAVKSLIEQHVRYAGAQGFATNIGGLVTAALTVPANIAGLALIQCRMVAAIAHLRGYDLDDRRVRNAILAVILGEDDVQRLIKKRLIPAPPMAIATAPAYDPELDKLMAAEVTSELLTRVAGKRAATLVGRRIPVVGGMIGAGTDGYATWAIGRYADRELLPRTRRQPPQDPTG
ncbi:MAG: EcsC family protein [Nocardioides sp.]